MRSRASGLLSIVGPGILVAATGIGAGDLATSAFTGRALGLAVLWAVVLGAFFKYVVNEGLARWQLATGSTLLEGCCLHFGRTVQWCFLAYLVLWSFMVGAALMSAVGVTCHAIYPLFGGERADADKIVYGIAHSLLAVILVRRGGFRLFERVMNVCILVMFAVVLATAIALRPSLRDVATGLVWPRIPPGGTSWTVALIGGIGGTLTVLCYGYWIREKGRVGGEVLTTCRIDLATGYIVTAFFGLGMIVIGSSLDPMPGSGAGLVVNIGRQLEATLGTAGPGFKWAFLIGAWGAVFSSLLGVWQSVPYLFADLWRLLHREAASIDPVDTRSLAYRGYLYGIATVPILGLAGVNFQMMQKTYAVTGALFVPLLAAALLVLNGRERWVGREFRNSWFTSLLLIAVIAFFLLAGAFELYEKLFAA